MKKPPRQGDLFFHIVGKADEANIGWVKHSGNLRKDGIIQEGEATGHHHRLKDPASAALFRPTFGEPIIIVGKAGATVVHPDHGPVKLAPNTSYRVAIANQLDLSGRTVRVRD